MNIKKIGLTALAGSLVATSVYAGEMTLSGTAKMTYSTKDGSGTLSTTGDSEASRIGLNQDMSASMSGELDNGFVVTLTHMIDNSATSTDGSSDSSYLTIDMGDMGTLSYVQDDLSGGLEALDDLMPTAYEEVSDGLTQSRAGMAVESGFSYSTTVSGATVGLQYSDGGSALNNGDGGVDSGASAGSSHSIGITYPVADTGLTVFGGVGTEGQVDDTEHDESVIGATYAMGAFTVGYQQNESDDSASSSAVDVESTLMGVSFSVNDDLSISYGHQESDKAGTATDEEVTGFDIAYSMGGATLAIYQHEVENSAFVDTADMEKTEIALTFAF